MGLCASEIEARIETAYQASGNELGWRFLYSPAAVLQRAEVAFIGLNPGGREVEACLFAMSQGSAYCDEVWGGSHVRGRSPLQVQVRAMFERLNVSPEAVLAGNFVPYRSGNWSELKQSDTALEFARRLWREVLEAVRPRVVIAMGNVVRDELAAMLGIKLTRLPTGWGKVQACRGTANGITLIALPHLSRYRVMDREASRMYMDQLFADL